MEWEKAAACVKGLLLFGLVDGLEGGLVLCAVTGS